MEATIKTNDKKTFKSLLRFLRDLGIEVIAKREEETAKKEEYNFFKSAGIWKGRNISGKTLREKAWQREK